MLAITSVAARSDPLVGRRSELEQLDAALEALAGGAPACLAVEGEPGIGKTRLLRELRRRAEERGALVLSGSAAEFERDLPYGVWVEALDAYVASQELELRADVDPELLADVAAVLPSVRAGDGSRAAARGDERHRAQRAMRRFLALVAERDPLVLILDDLHWSDAASAELIGAFVRRGMAPRVLLGLGYRTGRAPAGVNSALAARGVTLLELGSLSEHECRSLAGGELTPRRQAAIFRESGGNPFYALQLARAARLPARSTPGDRMAMDAGVPRTVAAALVEELDALTSPARTLLDAGSIAGDPFEPELACEIGKLSPDEGMPALDELLRAGLLHPTAVPRRFAFRHPLVRRAVYESTGGGWRLVAHARAASGLAARGGSAASQAHHVEQSAVQGDAAAIELLLQAGAATAPHAPAAAARWFGTALRLLPAADDAARLRTLISLAQVLRSTGDLDRCVATLLEAIDLVPAGETQLRVALTARCAAAENFLGRHEQAKQRLAAALESLPDQGSPEAVTALLALMAVAFFTFDADGACSFGRRALAAARPLRDPVLIGAAASGLAYSCSNAGAVPETRSSVDEAVVHLDAVSDEALAGHLDAINRLAWSEFLIERDDDAIRHAARGVSVARSTGQEQFLPLNLSTQALSTMRRGDLGAAAALQDEALEAAEVAANGYVMCWVLTNTAHVCMTRGDLDGAQRSAERALVHASGGGHVPTMARVRLAMTRRELGEPAAKVEDLVRGAGGWGLTRIPPSWRVPYAEAMTRVELGGGRVDDAERFALSAERAAEELGLPVATAMAQRARAAVRLARGDAEAATGLALASAEAAAAAPAPIEAARSHALAGRALAVAGERTRAVHLLRSAERTFDACGAERDRGEARHQLRRLGARSEPRGPSSGAAGGLESLSRREREIAGLVTARKTNREMAAELYLSEKTVESHLRNIFVKLGASSRVEVARAVENAHSGS
jgi:DNA-binding CsgD family transcriptional regulator/tetratricopeptide (TPR) repeat protein